MKKLKTITIFLLFSLLIVSPASAAEPKIVSGGKALLDDILKWLLILIPVAVAVKIAVLAFQKQMDEDDMHSASYQKRMKSALVWGGIGMGASGLATAFLNYFAS